MGGDTGAGIDDGTGVRTIDDDASEAAHCDGGMGKEIVGRLVCH
jgi:hypothetical protein